MFPDVRENLLLGLVAIPLIFSPPAGAADEPAPYRELYTWFNNSLDKHDEPGLQQISLDDGQLVLFTCWRGLAPGKHRYIAKIYDATGREILTHPLSFPGDKDEWEAWTRYRFQPGSDQSGMWRFEIYINDRLVEKQELFVDAAAPANAGTVAKTPGWRPVKQPVPAIPAHVAGTGTRGAVGIEVMVSEPDAEPSVSILQSEPWGLFDETVFEVVREWRFKAAVNDSDPEPQPLFYWIRFGGDKVHIEASDQTDMSGGFSFRKVGVTDAQEAMALMAEMNIAPGELAYFSVAAEFPTEFEAQQACAALAATSTWQPVWSAEGKWLCAAHEILVVGADSIRTFIDTAHTAFTRNRGRLYGTYVQDQL